jgi:hypothetical protein
MHTGVWPIKNADGDSLFANGCCVHMVIDIYVEWFAMVRISTKVIYSH